MSKKCSILKIEKLVAGELSEGEKKEFLAHIEECKECATLLNRLECERSEFLRIYPYREFEESYKKIKAKKDRAKSTYFLFKPSFAYAFLFVVAIIGIFGIHRTLNIKPPDEITFKGKKVSSVNFASLEKTTGKRYAFIVGQNDGGASVKPLRYANKDASDFADLLSKYGGFSKENIRLLLNTDSSEVVKTIDKFTKDIKEKLKKEKAFFLFYYTGHADKSGFLMKETHLSFAFVKDIVKRISENGGLAVSIIDACQSGVMVAFKGEETVEESFFYDNLPQIEGEIWVTSSAANERAQESESLKSSLFSFFLFTGLKGSADVSGDKRVTLTEAYQYASRKTLETSAMTSGILQHPLYRFNVLGEGEIVITELNSSIGGIRVADNCFGSFLILSEDYTTIYADFRKKVGSELFIALPEGEYIIINAKNENGTNIGFYKFKVTGEKSIYCSADSLKSSLYNTIKILMEG